MQRFFIVAHHLFIRFLLDGFTMSFCCWLVVTAAEEWRSAESLPKCEFDYAVIQFSWCHTGLLQVPSFFEWWSVMSLYVLENSLWSAEKVISSIGMSVSHTLQFYLLHWLLQYWVSDFFSLFTVKDWDAERGKIKNFLASTSAMEQEYKF